ncbi:protein of unknown function [Streptomyces murinus]
MVSEYSTRLRNTQVASYLQPLGKFPEALFSSVSTVKINSKVEGGIAITSLGCGTV